jgi:hypothetical protein
LPVAQAVTTPVTISQVILGLQGDQEGKSIATHLGKIYFAGGATQNTGDGLIGAYNSTLSQLDWSQALGGAHGTATGIAVSDRVYVSGYSRPPLLTIDTVGGAEIKGVTAATSLSGGTYAYRTQTPAAPGFFSYGGGEVLNAIAVDHSTGSDTLFVTGIGEEFSGLGGLTVAKVNGSSGAVLAKTTFGPGGFGDQWWGAGAVMNGSSVVVAGYHYIGSTAHYEAMIRGYDQNLGLLWSDNAITGDYHDVTTAGGITYAAGQNGTNGLAAAYDAAGHRLWSQNYAGMQLNGIVGLGGNLYAAGNSGGHGLILMIDPLTGNALGQTTVFGAGTDNFTDIAANAVDGTLYAIGTTQKLNPGVNDSDIWIVGLRTAAVPEPEVPILLSLGMMLLAFKRLHARRQ